MPLKEFPEKHIKSRREELAEQFARGTLPEQEGVAPGSVWCDECRGRGSLPIPKSEKREPCDKCDATGVLHR